MTTAAPVTVYRIPDGTFEPRAEGYSYGVERHNGMERTYRATVYLDGRRIGATGGCTSPGRAEDRARALARTHARKNA